jgi:phenylacetate-CoA ligase
MVSLDGPMSLDATLREVLLERVRANARRIGDQLAETLRVMTEHWVLDLQISGACPWAQVGISAKPKLELWVSARDLAEILSGRGSVYRMTYERRLSFRGDDWALLRLAGLFSAVSDEASGPSWEGDAIVPPGHVPGREQGDGAAVYEEVQRMLQHAWGALPLEARGPKLRPTREVLRDKCSWYAARLRHAEQEVASSHDCEWLPSRLPVTNRADLARFNRDLRLIPEDAQADKNVVQRTTGTSGDRLTVCRTHESLRRLVARYALVLLAVSERRLPVTVFLDPGLDLCAVLGRVAPLRVVSTMRSVSEQWEGLLSAEAEALYAFPVALRGLAVHALRSNRSYPNLRTILVVGDLIDAPLRRVCAEVFPGATLYGTYGCTETGLLGIECRARQGFHLCDHELTFAVRLPNGRLAPSGRGQLLVSQAGWEGTPLLNYEVGDEVELIDEPCACGMRAPRLRVHGRHSSGVALPTRHLMPGDCADLFEAVPEIAGFQLQVKSAKYVRLVCETRSGAPVEEESGVRHVVRTLLGDPSVDVEIVSSRLVGGTKIPILVGPNGGLA